MLEQAIEQVGARGWLPVRVDKSEIGGDHGEGGSEDRRLQVLRRVGRFPADAGTQSCSSCEEFPPHVQVKGSTKAGAADRVPDEEPAGEAPAQQESCSTWGALRDEDPGGLPPFLIGSSAGPDSQA